VRSLVLDAGALISLDRNDRTMWSLLRVAADEARPVLVPTAVIAQAWRDGTRQVPLSRALAHCEEVPLDGFAARAAGLLCAASKTSDVIDATVVLVAAGNTDGSTIATSDRRDIERLLAALGTSAAIIEV